MKISELKKGDFFKLSENGCVYVRDSYDRSSKKYECYKYDDINAFRYLKGNKDTKKNVDDYLKQIQRVKEEEQKAIDAGAKSSNQVNTDRSAYLDNLFRSSIAFIKASLRF